MTIRVCDIDPLLVITGLHHTAGDTMMATSFIPFNTAKNPYLLDNVTVVNSPLLGCWKNISEWKRCQWVKKKTKTFLLRQRLKNIETLIIKEDSKKRSYILAHTHTHAHTVVNQFISLPTTCPLSPETAGILLCSVTSQTCTPSPWKQSCHPSWVSVCLLPPKHRHTCIYSRRKTRGQLF